METKRKQITEKDLPARFVRLLKRKRALERYLEEVNKASAHRWRELYCSDPNFLQGGNVLMNAFLWCDTEEGGVFWSDINNEYDSEGDGLSIRGWGIKKGRKGIYAFGCKHFTRGSVQKVKEYILSKETAAVEIPTDRLFRTLLVLKDVNRPDMYWLDNAYEFSVADFNRLLAFFHMGQIKIEKK